MSEKEIEQRREARRRYCEKHHDRELERQRKYREANRERRRKADKEWKRKYRSEHYEEYRAHFLGHATSRRNIPLKDKCEMCDSPAQVRHHPDYSKRGLVIHLCRSCHGKLHGKSKRIVSAIFDKEG